MLPTSEEAILGMAMHDSKARAAMIAALRKDHFRVPEHQTVFELIERQHLADKPADPATLNVVHGKGDIALTLCDLDCKRPITLEPDAFINAILERDWRSSVMDETQKVLSSVQRQAEVSIDELADRFNRRPTATGLGIENPILAQIADDDLEGRMRDRLEGRKSYLSTGWGQLDSMIHGFGPSSFTVLAGRPGAGKTSLALHFAMQALAQCTPTAFCTWEMTERELLRKMLANMSRVSLSKMLEGNLTDEEVDRYLHARNKFAEYPFVVFNALPDLETVCAEVTRFVVRKNVRLVFIDYLGLIPTRTKHNSPRERMIEVTRRIKKLAGDLEVPIVGLAQLRRPSQTGNKYAPTRNDLKESGSLEEDADNVLLIWKQEDEKSGKVRHHLLVDKARHGTEGRVEFKADFSTNRFWEEA